MLYIKSVVALASLSGMAVASPLVKRQTPDTCTTFTSGHLVVRPSSDTVNGTVTYAGITDGAHHTGIDGDYDSLIVTKDSNGNPLGPQVWEFARCTNQDGQAPPPGYQGPTNGPINNYFGILRPQAATQHCLALESTSDTSNGARNSVVDSYCTQVPSEYRTWMYVDFVYGDSSVPIPLYFAGQNTTIVIGNTAHQELQFFTNDPTPGGEAMQLQLVRINPNP